EEQRGARELAKSLKGWYDREQGGFMMRSSEDAQQIVDGIVKELTKLGVKVKEEHNEDDVLMREDEKESLIEESQDLTTTIVSSTSDGAKVVIRIEDAKENLQELSSTYKSVTRSRGFLSDLNRALGNNESGTESHYFNFENADGDIITIRTSNHNANSDNFENGANAISIVVKSRRAPNSFKGDNKVNLTEYVYFKESIVEADGNVLSEIADSINGLLSNGKFVDKTGIAVINRVTEKSLVGPRELRKQMAERVNELAD
ncbi:MAG: hypothetical protein RR280_10650, partial [Bacteroidaceae bacterium]